jgi:hypothetical protein
VVSIILLSLGSIILSDRNLSPDNLQNKIARIFYDIVTTIGKSKFQFFIFSIITLFVYVDTKSIYFKCLFLYSIIATTEPWHLIRKISIDSQKQVFEGIGTVFGVQSKSIFLVKLYNLSHRETVKLFESAIIKHTVDAQNKIYYGVIVDNYILDEEQWIKILIDESLSKQVKTPATAKDLLNGVVYKYSDPTIESYINTIVGIITEKSTINSIKFIYNSRFLIKENQIVSVTIHGFKVYYQIIGAKTEIEELEKKNKGDLIVGEAIQLGCWKEDEGKFEKFGWVPKINSVVNLAPIDEPYKLNDSEIIIGYLPETKFPLIMNKKIAISHHTAILGVTGTGKTTFVLDLIREIIKDDDVHVICVDFTDEYKGKLGDLNPIPVIKEDSTKVIFKTIDEIESIVSAKYGKENDETKQKRKEISTKIHEELKGLFQTKNKISIFELPDVSNTTGILEYTKIFFRILFYMAKKKEIGKRLCVVLEEAHTVIPEHNFLGISDKNAGSLVNSVSQIALQGRKYDIGFLVIAQRTANVSKTVLTQCNSVIVFQEFDKTSNDFLSNYFGSQITQVLPTLRFRQAVAFGKAFRTTIPLIFEVPKKEPFKN